MLLTVALFKAERHLRKRFHRERAIPGRNKKSSPMDQEFAIIVPLTAIEKFSDIVILKMLRLKIGRVATPDGGVVHSKPVCMRK